MIILETKNPLCDSLHCHCNSLLQLEITSLRLERCDVGKVLVLHAANLVDTEGHIWSLSLAQSDA